MTSEQKLKDLTNVSRQALADYDELLQKYNSLVEENERNKQEIINLQDVVEPMYDEFGEIQTKYQVEKSLREAAESYASKVVNDNKIMKRQSAAIFSKMGSMNVVDIDFEDMADPSTGEQQRIEELNKTVTDLENKVAKLTVELRKAQDEKDVLSAEVDDSFAEKEEYRAKYEQLTSQTNAFKQQYDELKSQLTSQSKTFQLQQREFKNFKRASSAAVVDYQTLEEKYEIEKALRLKAEIYAKELQRKRDSFVEQKRASTHNDLNGEGKTDKDLQKLIDENEKLHNDISELEISYKSQVDDLEQQLKDSTNQATIDNLEEKVSFLTDDMERLSNELETHKHDNKHLKEMVTKLEKERDEFLRIPIPPPPPPPPGPAAGIRLPLIKPRKAKKEQLIKKVTGAPKSDAMQNAMAEMMERIRKGPILTPVAATERPDDLTPQQGGEAMQHAHNYLVKKKIKVRTLKPLEQPTIDDELAKKFAARSNLNKSLEDIRERSNSADSNPQEENELTKKLKGQLNKQQSADPPVPKPKPRRPTPVPVQRGNKEAEELQERLAAARNKIPEDEKSEKE